MFIRLNDVDFLSKITQDTEIRRPVIDRFAKGIFFADLRRSAEHTRSPLADHI